MPSPKPNRPCHELLEDYIPLRKEVILRVKLLKDA